MDTDLRDDWAPMRDWNVLRAATEKGWKDPGLTEPMADTVNRAQDYLDALAKAEAETSAAT